MTVRSFITFKSQATVTNNQNFQICLFLVILIVHEYILQTPFLSHFVNFFTRMNFYKEYLQVANFFHLQETVSKLHLILTFKTTVSEWLNVIKKYTWDNAGVH